MRELKEFERKLLECLGGEWPEQCDLNPQLEDTIQRDGYRIERVSYCVEPDERVPAYLLIPEGVDSENPRPAVAVWHQHAGRYDLGKSEPAGLIGDSAHFTGVSLAQEGYVVLCPDTLCFEERQDRDLPRGDFERFLFLRYLASGKCLAWKYILDMRRALDFLCQRPEVASDALGCYGHSLGSTCSWLLGPWESRLKCLVGNCCLPTYEAIHRTKLLHGFANFVPGLYKHGDFQDVVALIAPRPLHLNFGTEDWLSPIKEVRTAVERIHSAYRDLGSSENFSYFIEENQGHVLSREMWARTRDKFLHYLPLT